MATRQLMLTKKVSGEAGHMFEVSLLAPPMVLGMPSDWACMLLAGAAVAGGLAHVPMAWLAMIGTLSALCLVRSLTTVTREELMLMHGMGVQTASHMRCGLRQGVRFLALERIASVFITEGIVSDDVVYSLTFELSRGVATCIAFEALRPQLHLLKEVYRDVHDLLAKDKNVEKSSSSTR